MPFTIEILTSRRAAEGREPERSALLLRGSRIGDEPALERLAALDSRELPEGGFLLAEADGELVAALPLDADAGPIRDPFRPTAHIVELLELRVRSYPTNLRRAA
jgi:hypothetical protein